MKRGFVLDNSYVGQFVSLWAEGAPVKTIWGITKLPDEKLMPIGTYRCAACGFLEL
jgi:hypothetical protein